MKANQNRNTNIRRFYFLSLLCLVPLFGFIVAIVLSVNAIIRFKSIPLFLTIIAMTAGGVVIMQMDKAYLQRELRYGNDADKGFALLAAQELDQIAKGLQKYKTKHGDYPDSLQPLEKEGFVFSVKDPLLGRNPPAHKSLTFNYKKTKDGYVLFSSGVDGIPNTKDDIYPRVALK